jgi:septal ring factor EnvC (AmiA/AmiB activator)
VLYAGDDLKGYGWVVMVEQEDGYITVYTRAERVFVKKGESVKKSQVLGRLF